MGPPPTRARETIICWRRFFRVRVPQICHQLTQVFLHFRCAAQYADGLATPLNASDPYEESYEDEYFDEYDEAPEHPDLPPANV